MVKGGSTDGVEGTDGATPRVVEVALAGTSLPQILRSAQSVDVGADAILAGAVETIEGRQVGRIRFTVVSASQSKELIESLRADGIYAEEAV